MGSGVHTTESLVAGSEALARGAWSEAQQRFKRTVRLLERHDRDRFAEIAQRCGYYDQAHMNLGVAAD